MNSSHYVIHFPQSQTFLEDDEVFGDVRVTRSPNRAKEFTSPDSPEALQSVARLEKSSFKFEFKKLAYSVSDIPQEVVSEGERDYHAIIPDHFMDSPEETVKASSDIEAELKLVAKFREAVMSRDDQELIEYLGLVAAPNRKEGQSRADYILGKD